MQRRAAAVYFVLFVLVGAGAYGFMQVGMSKPAVDLQEQVYTQNAEIEVGGQTYMIANISTEGEGDSPEYVGKLTWFNESARESTAIENNATIGFQDGEYRVSIPNETDPSSFALVEEPNVSAILANDPAVENETGTQGDETYVFYQNGSRVLLSEYLPPAETVELAVGDEFEYQAENATARVDAISSSEVAVSWAAPGEETIELSEGSNVTLNGQTHFAHFPGDGVVQILPTDEYYGEYNQQLQNINAWEERQNGVWGMVLLSVLAAILLVAMAYLPVKG
jgi:hypothetical protein